MRIEFIGAAHEVTGSCHYLKIGEKHILVDCGMEQGADIYENQDIPVNAAAIDYVFVTHAHIDHSGLLPLLYARGFRGQIFATNATTQLCNIMLKDSAHIQEFEADWRNRKARRAGQPLSGITGRGIISFVQTHNKFITAGRQGCGGLCDSFLR